MSCESVHSDNKDSATAPKLRRHATRHQPATTPSKKLCLMSLLKVATKTSSAHTHYLYQLLRLRRHGLIDPPVNKQPNKQSLMKTQPEAPQLLPVFSSPGKQENTHTPWFCHLYKQQEFWGHLASVSFLFHQQNTPTTSSSSPAREHYKYKSILSAILGWPHLITPCRMQQGTCHSRVCAGLANLAYC